MGCGCGWEAGVLWLLLLLVMAYLTLREMARMMQRGLSQSVMLLGEGGGVMPEALASHVSRVWILSASCAIWARRAWRSVSSCWKSPSASAGVMSLSPSTVAAVSACRVW